MADLWEEPGIDACGDPTTVHVVIYARDGDTRKESFTDRRSALAFKREVEGPRAIRRAPAPRRVVQRFRDDAPGSPAPQSSPTATDTYDPAEHTVELVLSEGSAVDRWYGVEVLSVDQAAVDIGRLRTSGIPLLDSHDSSSIRCIIGRVEAIWFAGGSMMGRAIFANTEAGQLAEGMVARGELRGISIGYRVDAWSITDANGNPIDADVGMIYPGDDLTFTATHWELHEVSFVAIPADPAAKARAKPGTRTRRSQRLSRRQLLSDIAFGTTPAGGYVSRGR